MHAVTQTNGDQVTNRVEFSDEDTSRIIEMAWEDRIPFEAIELQFNLDESAVVQLMRQHLKRSSFKLWRTRTAGRKTKHLKLRSPDVLRGYCSRQYKPS